jgi:hypothetical protein
MNDLSPIKAPKSGRELLAGVKVIDVDTHISEPWDLWTSRAPKHLKNRVPRFVETDGVPHWVIDHDTFLAPLNGFSAVMRDGSKVYGYDFNKKSVAEVHEGASNVKARLKYMDDQGIYAQVAYPNLLGFGGQKAQQIDEALRVDCMRIFNDAMAEWQTQSGGRIYPMALLPWWNVEQSVEAGHQHQFRPPPVRLATAAGRRPLGPAVADRHRSRPAGELPHRGLGRLVQLVQFGELADAQR